MPLTIVNNFDINKKHATYMINEVLGPIMNACSLVVVDMYGHPISMDEALNSFYTGDLAKTALIYLGDPSNDKRKKLGSIKFGLQSIANIRVKISFDFMSDFEYPSYCKISYNTATDLEVLKPVVEAILTNHKKLSVSLNSENFENYVDREP